MQANINVCSYKIYKLVLMCVIARIKNTKNLTKYLLKSKGVELNTKKAAIITG